MLAQAAADNQQKGKSGQLVDPRPETVEGGEIKIRITPQLVHDIFDEYPVVAMAYSENVPNKVNPFFILQILYSVYSDWIMSWLDFLFFWQLTEEQFWKRYFQSKLFNAHRASIRSSATQHVVKDDEIFDKYLERDDDGEFRINTLLHWVAWQASFEKELEPRRQRSDPVQAFIDLAATLEDHGEVNHEQFLLFHPILINLL